MKIAILDDDESIRTTVSLILKQTGHTPKAFSTEDELFLGLESFDPDMVILDQMLGGKRTGMQLVQVLRDRFSDLPIVIASGYPKLGFCETAEFDNVSFLPKPFSFSALEEQILKFSAG